MLALDVYQRIDAAARKCASERLERQGDLAGLWRRLGAVGSQSDMQKRLEQAEHYLGAVPTAEQTDSSFPAIEQSLPCIGIDGSQVYPDEKSPVLWAYAQAIAFRQGHMDHLLLPRFWGDVEAPLPESAPSWLDAERTLLEMEAAYQAAQRWPDHLILLDNPLIAWFDYYQNAEYLKRYLSLLKNCFPRWLAGVVSSPRSTLLVDLIRAADCSNPQAWKRQPNDVSDTALIRHGIPVGRRSALFKHAPARNRPYQAAETAVYFFFIRLTEKEVVRVEIPQWLAQPETVEQVHASALADSFSLGYSYALTQAHRMVVISQDVADALRQRAERVYFEETQKTFWQSRKQAVKAAIANR
ncbi:MAG: DNA double-strand break repair nuclease NurA [Anaerolineae bacterium]|nr:DNA double-strand break repair nuclease NurA [Anaerolineae bacterium]